MMIIQHDKLLGLVHILKPYTFKSEFRTVVRCLVYVIFQKNILINFIRFVENTRSLYFMRVHMPFQVPFSKRGIRTFVAFVRFFSAVCLHMQAQTT